MGEQSSDAGVKKLVRADTRINVTTLAAVVALIFTLISGLLWAERRMTQNEGRVSTETAIREAADRQIRAEMSAIRDTANRSEARLDERLDLLHSQIDAGFNRIERRLERMEKGEE